MDSNGEKSEGNSLTQIIPILRMDWIFIILQLYRGWRKLLKLGAPEGLYEVLEYDSVLELIDVKGDVSHFNKHHKIRFLQNNTIAYEDFAWGDGDVLRDYRCSPGVVVDQYREGDRWNILISLRETKSTGDVQDFHIERKILKGFTKKEEWWQIEMQHHTKLLKLSIIFPTRRHCKSASLVERISNRTENLGLTHFTILPDGRQLLTWMKEDPKDFETYTFKWQW